MRLDFYHHTWKTPSYLVKTCLQSCTNGAQINGVLNDRQVIRAAIKLWIHWSSKEFLRKRESTS